MAHEVGQLTLAEVDLDDSNAMVELLQRDLKGEDVRIKEAVRRMQQQGLINADGRRLHPELPADMCEDSTTDFGG